MYWKKAVTADCARGVSSQGLPPTEHARNTQTHTHTLTLTLTRALSLSHTHSASCCVSNRQPDTVRRGPPSVGRGLRPHCSSISSGRPPCSGRWTTYARVLRGASYAVPRRRWPRSRAKLRSPEQLSAGAMRRSRRASERCTQLAPWSGPPPPLAAAGSGATGAIGRAAADELARGGGESGSDRGDSHSDRRGMNRV